MHYQNPSLYIKYITGLRKYQKAIIDTIGSFKISHGTKMKGMITILHTWQKKLLAGGRYRINY